MKLELKMYNWIQEPKGKDKEIIENVKERFK